MAKVSPGSTSFENVWEDAYSRLQKEQPDLLRAYEDGILEETRAKCRDTRLKQLQPLKSNSHPTRLAQQLQVVLEVQSEYIEERQWSLHVGRKDVKIRDAVRATVKAIDAAKNFIGPALSSEPHAALAWAGVSCILPLLLNATMQDDDAIEGLNYVQDMLSRYRVVQKVLMENKILAQAGFDDSEVRTRLRAGIVELYLQILVYQFALIKQYSHSKAKQTLNNLVRRYNWKQKLADVKGVEQGCESHRKVLETETQALISQRLLDQSAKLDKLIDTTKEQHARQNALDERASMEKWLSAMYPPDMDDLHTLLRNEVPAKLRGHTGKWFVEQVKGWLTEDKHMIYWGRGDPGVGKSMLVSETVEQIGRSFSESNFEAYAFVYFQWDKQNQQTPTAVLASILSKLWRGSRGLTEKLLKLHSESRESHLLPSVSELQSILSAHGRPSSDGEDKEKTQARFLLLIDGLDEATAETRTELIECINAVSPRHFRVVITSRKDLSVTTSAALTTEFAIQAAPKDLELFVYAELSQIQPNIARPIFAEHPGLREKLTREIGSRADGMFLLVKHHTIYVGQQTTASQMQDAASKPFDLEVVYSEMLKHAELDQQLSETAIKALGWLTYAHQTFTASLLAEALAIMPGDVVFDSDNVASIERVAQLCRGLMVYDTESDTIRLAHQTVKDYLRQLDLIKQCHSVLAATCFTALALNPDRDNNDRSVKKKSSATAIDRSGTEDFIARLAQTDLDLDHRAGDALDEPPSATEIVDHLPDEGSHPESNEVKTKASPNGLDAWANRPTAFTTYAGRYSIDHLIVTEKRPEVVVDAIWRFLSRQPVVGHLQSLARGNNKYPEGCTPMHVATWMQTPSLINQLIEEGIDVNVRDADQKTPLMYAAMHGDPNLIKELLRLGADAALEDVDRHVAVEMLKCDLAEDVVRRLLPQGRKYKGVLLSAAKSGLTGCCRVFLEEGVGRINATGSRGRTPLHLAARGGHTAVVALLCAHKAQVNVPDSGGSTPLQLAIESGSIRSVDVLLKHGADPNIVDERNEHALLRAAWGGREQIHHLDESTILSIVDALLECGAKLETKSNQGGTAIWEAQQYPSVLKRLIKAGSDIHFERIGLTTFQNLAINEPDSRSYEVMLDAEQRLAKKEGRPFTTLLPNSEGNTALHLTAASKNLRAVEKLLYIGGLEVDVRNLAGQTPLFMAMHLHGDGIAQQLLAAGAQTDVVDYHGNSILDAAITAGTPAMIGRILEGRCSIETPHWSMESPQVQRLVDEAWYDQLKALIDARNERTSLVHDWSHKRADLQVPITINNSDLPRDKRILQVEVPDNCARVERVTFHMRSSDQGYSWKETEYGGTYSQAFSLFEAGIRRRGQSPKFESVRTVQKNLHADRDPRPYTISWDRDSKDPRDKEWITSLSPGDTIMLRAQCHGSGWQNRVKDARIELWMSGVKASQ